MSSSFLNSRRIIAAATAPLLLIACDGIRRHGGDGAIEPPPYERLARTHNDRVDRLGRVYSRGVIQLRWTDEDGRHFEQGDLDLWLHLPGRSALNISKFGERLLWIGSDASQAWMFDFRGDETVLFVADADAAGDATALPIDPRELLTLCGLTRVAVSPDGNGEPVGYDAEHDAWVVGSPSQGRRVRLYLDRNALLPIRVEILDGERQIAIFSHLKLQRYERVAVAGAPVGSGPQFPTLADLMSADDRLAVKLSVPSPSDDDSLEDRFFDLDRLIDTFKPGRIEGFSSSVADAREAR